MAHSLTLELPESLYEHLSELAESQGRKVEEVALDKLANGSGATEDPFEKFIGAFDSGGMDWANRHDEYLGASLFDEMHGKSE